MDIINRFWMWVVRSQWKAAKANAERKILEHVAQKPYRPNTNPITAYKNPDWIAYNEWDDKLKRMQNRLKLIERELAEFQ